MQNQLSAKTVEVSRHRSSKLLGDRRRKAHDPVVDLTKVKVEIRPTAEVRPHSNNVRTHPAKQVAQIAESIVAFGWTVPILVDENGIALAGAGRLLAAEKLGLTHVPVISVSNLNESQKRAYILADNKISANAGYDRKRLGAEIAELTLLLPEIDLDIGITGFEAIEIDTLHNDLIDPEAEPEDELPAPISQVVTQRGDLWGLGDHRLLCDDCRDPDSFYRLMRKRRAAIVFADPPYNRKIREIQGRGKIKHPDFVIASGEMTRAEFTAFLVQTLRNTAEFSEDGSIHFICTDWRHLLELQMAGEQVYFELKNVVVWNKTNSGQGTFYRSQYELIFVFKVGTASHTNNFELGQKGRHRSNVWTYAGTNTFRSGRMEEIAMHPTVKPVSLVADAIRECSKRGEIVLDPFMGSGTTIMAAERVGRRGYGIEIDPRYVDVAIRRWQTFTKRDAVLRRTGETFDQLSAARPGRES